MMTGPSVGMCPAAESNVPNEGRNPDGKSMSTLGLICHLQTNRRREHRSLFSEQMSPRCPYWTHRAHREAVLR
jgi:hypothetical protein